MARGRNVGTPSRLPALLAALVLLLLAGGAAAQAVVYQEAVSSYESFTVRARVRRRQQAVTQHLGTAHACGRLICSSGHHTCAQGSHWAPCLQWELSYVSVAGERVYSEPLRVGSHTW